jgi:hypothetical protein
MLEKPREIKAVSRMFVLAMAVVVKGASMIKALMPVAKGFGSEAPEVAAQLRQVVERDAERATRRALHGVAAVAVSIALGTVVYWIW